MSGSARQAGEKLRTLAWFAARPSFYPYMAALLIRKMKGSDRLEHHYREAFAWASERTVTRNEAFGQVGLLEPGAPLLTLPPHLIEEASRKAEAAPVTMGGPGDLDLLYDSILFAGATRVVETGVAYGWSSLAALAALRETGGRLVSVDMPYPKMGNEPFVGMVVPPDWRDRWTLIRRPDRNGLKRAIADFRGEIDLCHYDSDKSYAGRMFAYPILWRALRPGGVFISDDISDNFAFRDFFATLGQPFAVVECRGKHIGIARKAPGGSSIVRHRGVD